MHMPMQCTCMINDTFQLCCGQIFGMATLSTSASPPGPQSALRDLLFRIRNVELESACVNLGLRKTGRKADLVGRIVEAVSQVCTIAAVVF